MNRIRIGEKFDWVRLWEKDGTHLIDLLLQRLFQNWLTSSGVARVGEEDLGNDGNPTVARTDEAVVFKPPL